MKTKIIPFDLETAKKIQAGEIKGRIKSPLGIDVRIICWDKMCFGEEKYPIVALIKGKIQEAIYEVDIYGEVKHEESSLILEVLNNEQQFKPFDKVLCRDGRDAWKVNLFSHEVHGVEYPYFVCGGSFYKQCIPFEGHENLVGTTDEPEGN